MPNVVPAPEIEMVETELATLTRTLEGLRRRSEIHRDLDRASYLLARTLAVDGSSSINGLADRLGLDATTVTRQVAAMEADGLVRRRRDARDARVSRIELSALGTRRMHEVREARQDRIARLLRGWPTEDAQAFGKLLARFNDAIRKETAPRPAA